MNLRSFFDVNSRREAIEEHLGINLKNIGKYSLDEKHAGSRNCENMIGTIQIPLGVAGPLTINTFIQSDSSMTAGNEAYRQRSEVKASCYIPLATTEGALVASVSRGCRALAESGGVNIISEKIGVTRAPVFEVENIIEGQKFITYINENFNQIKKIAGSTSSHLTLLKIVPFTMGKNVWLRYFFDTRDAMGMNMATIAVDQTIPYIEKNTTAKCIALSGNVCVDKKPNFLNFIEGRGCRVWADAVIPDDIVSSVLKTTSDKICKTGLRKVLYGSIISASLGANSHIANIIAAIFIATGQDAAHISECSMGITNVEKVEKGLYISVFLPDILVGTVGGGTGLSTQREALSIIGLKEEKPKNAGPEFAQIIGGAVLAGELSLLASLSEGSLAKAHKKLGRGK